MSLRKGSVAVIVALASLAVPAAHASDTTPPTPTITAPPRPVPLIAPGPAQPRPIHLHDAPRSDAESLARALSLIALSAGRRPYPAMPQ